MRRIHILLLTGETEGDGTSAALLRRHGYEVDVASSPTGARRAIAARSFDLAVLDLSSLPGVDGARTCRLFANRKMRVLVVTAVERDADRNAALDVGADDFMTKPFQAGELLSRIRLCMRRAWQPPPERRLMRCGDLTFRPDQCQIVDRGQTIHLTRKEFDLLSLLARHSGRVVARDNILRAIWGPDALDHPEYAWVLVRNLRKKIEADPSRPHRLVTAPWVGYRLVARAEPQRA